MHTVSTLSTYLYNVNDKGQKQLVEHESVVAEEDVQDRQRVGVIG